MNQADKIEKDYNRHLKIVETYISGDRKDRVLSMLKDLEDNLVVSPSSGNRKYHNAFAGGYLDHVNRVVQLSLKQREFWEPFFDIDFTEEELVFSALFHDIGKLGDVDMPYYIPQEDEWRKNKLGEVYMRNTSLDYMLPQDRSLFLLQRYGIQCTSKEFLAIKLYSGMYDETNKPYLVTYDIENSLKTILPYIIHISSFMAAKFSQMKNK